MKKSVFCLVLAALLVLAAIPAAAEKGEVIEVSTVEGLKAMAEAPAGDYVLTADIDLAGEEWTPFDFSGTLDGRGHILMNLKVTAPGAVVGTSVDGNRKKYDTVFAGLFAHMEGAKVQNLTILGAYVEMTREDPCFCGMLAGSGHNVSVSGVSASGRVRLTQSAVMSGVAGLVGYGNGDFDSCTVDAELVFIDTNTKDDCEEFAAGIMACGYPNVTGCTVKTDIYASVHGYCHNGGLVGMHHVDTHDSVRGTVEGNTVDCRLTFFEDVGSRRAYGAATVGEPLNRDLTVGENEVLSFERIESKDYSTPLVPCTHKDSMTATIIAANCTELGYSEHVCDECGYTYRDSYKPFSHTTGEWETVKPATYTESGLRRKVCADCGKTVEEEVLQPHTAGDWETEKEPTYSEEGLRVRRCTDCGEILESEPLAPHTEGEWTVEQAPTLDAEGIRVRVCPDCGQVIERESIPRLQRAEACAFAKESLSLAYKDTAQPELVFYPESAVGGEMTWSVSDEKVLHVEPDGAVTAVGAGDAVLTAAGKDGIRAECVVHVRYTPRQWVIMTLGWGWLWY